MTLKKWLWTSPRLPKTFLKTHHRGKRGVQSLKSKYKTIACLTKTFHIAFMGLGILQFLLKRGTSEARLLTKAKTRDKRILRTSLYSKIETFREAGYISYVCMFNLRLWYVVYTVAQLQTGTASAGICSCTSNICYC